MSIISNSYVSWSQKIDFIGTEKVLFKKGDILLNGKKITIDSTISGTAYNINKRSIETGVRAQIEKSSTGEAKLILVSISRTVSITDPSKILLTLYSNNKIGRGSDKLLQIIGNSASNRNVTVRYSTQSINTTEVKHLNLSETTSVKTQTKNNFIKNIELAEIIPELQQQQIMGEAPAIENDLYHLPMVEEAPVLREVEPAMDPIHIPTTITPREINSTNTYDFGSELDIGDIFPSFSFSSLAWGAAKYAYETGKHYTSEAYKYATKEINQFI